LLLAREVDFRRELETLAGALREYRALWGVRAPQVIPSLSTSAITALTFERGKKPRISVQFRRNSDGAWQIAWRRFSPPSRHSLATTRPVSMPIHTQGIFSMTGELTNG